MLSLVRMAARFLREPTGGVPARCNRISAHRRVVVLGSSFRRFHSSSESLPRRDGGGGGGLAAVSGAVVSVSTSREDEVAENGRSAIGPAIVQGAELEPLLRDRKSGRPTCWHLDILVGKWFCGRGQLEVESIHSMFVVAELRLRARLKFLGPLHQWFTKLHSTAANEWVATIWTAEVSVHLIESFFTIASVSVSTLASSCEF